MLDARGWSVTEVAEITGFARSHLSGVLSGKTGISADLAIALSAAFGNEAAEWLRVNAEHQLSLVEVDAPSIERRAKLFTQAPIREMQKRGWLRESASVADLEAEVDRFFDGGTGAVFAVATLRRDSQNQLSPAERAWCFRARKLAADLPFVAAFEKSRLGSATKKLRQLAAYEKETERISEMLAYYGIRFVVVEPLPGAKIDGAAFWIDGSPVIAVSLRWDRIDAFWFTVMHEFMHIANGDAYSVDVNLVDEGEHGLSVALSTDEVESRASSQAAELLVPQRQLESFISRTSPRYAATRIIQFAHAVKMHPGIIVGQLQHRGELSYSAHRSFLARVRKAVAATSVTDGWGYAPSARRGVGKRGEEED